MDGQTGGGRKSWPYLRRSKETGVVEAGGSQCRAARFFLPAAADSGILAAVGRGLQLTAV